MTYVSCISLDTNRCLKEYQVEVMTFDGESEKVYVVARTSRECSGKGRSSGAKRRLYDGSRFLRILNPPHEDREGAVHNGASYFYCHLDYLLHLGHS